jgi:hypothetical protein
MFSYSVWGMRKAVRNNLIRSSEEERKEMKDL